MHSDPQRGNACLRKAGNLADGIIGLGLVKDLKEAVPSFQTMLLIKVLTEVGALHGLQQSRTGAALDYDASSMQNLHRLLQGELSTFKPLEDDEVRIGALRRVVDVALKVHDINPTDSSSSSSLAGFTSWQQQERPDLTSEQLCQDIENLKGGKLAKLMATPGFLWLTRRVAIASSAIAVDASAVDRAEVLAAQLCKLLDEEIASVECLEGDALKNLLVKLKPLLLEMEQIEAKSSPTTLERISKAITIASTCKDIHHS